MSIKLIYASTPDRVIGRNGKLPWLIKEDLEHFKHLTIGHPVVMGYNTWVSLPGRQRPLKDRTNIVLSRTESLKLPGAIIYHSLEHVLKDYQDQDIWIIGGGKLLRQAIKIADEIYLTLVHNRVQGDTLSPEIDHKWQLTEQSEILESGINKFQFMQYKRLE